MINGFEYAWEDIQVVANGDVLPLDGIVKIEYGLKRDLKNIYGRGNKPIARGRGNKEPYASITVLQSAFEGWQRSLAKGKDITDIKPFTVTVSYAPEGGVVTTDQIISAQYTEIKKGMKQGDGNMEIEIPLVVGDIKFNV